MSRWGRPRKNKKFIDPRYFMDEKMERLDEVKTTIDPLGEGGPVRTIPGPGTTEPWDPTPVRAKPVYADDFLAYIDGYQFSDERYREALKEVIADIDAQPETPRSYTGEVAIIEHRALQAAIEKHPFARGFNLDVAKYHGDNQLLSIADAMWKSVAYRDSRVRKYIKDRGPEGLGESQIPDYTPSNDPRLVGRMKWLYSKVIKTNPEFELLNDITGPPKSVDLFIKAYEIAGQQGMANVHEIVSAMDKLRRGNY